MTTSNRLSLMLLLMITMAYTDEMCREMYNINASASAFESLSFFRRCFETTDCKAKESTRSVTSGGYIRLVYTCRLPESTLPPSQLITAMTPKPSMMAVIGVLAILLLAGIIIGFCCCCGPTCLKRTCDAICVRRPYRGIRPSDTGSNACGTTSTVAWLFTKLLHIVLNVYSYAHCISDYYLLYNYKLLTHSFKYSLIWPCFNCLQ